MAGFDPGQLGSMDAVLDRPWTPETFLAWEDRQEGRYEFDGRRVIPMTSGSIAATDRVIKLMNTPRCDLRIHAQFNRSSVATASI
ncbi:MAG: hypothetical protein QOG25_3812 [Acetobacteraceae bacterium]|jgi:hypothetical protein|nr:hypothetical protein [Acetobacteraceae bacterium]